jgi:hypothetical protein
MKIDTDRIAGFCMSPFVTGGLGVANVIFAFNWLQTLAGVLLLVIAGWDFYKNTQRKI